MKEKMGIVNVFSKPYEIWSVRDATPEEFQKNLTLKIKENVVKVISSHVEAAIHILTEQFDNGLECHINRELDASVEFHKLLNLMPHDLPDALSVYQSNFSQVTHAFADKAINDYGTFLAENQLLFHGGCWSINANSLATSRPFSTSFCPQVALRNAEWRGKAYDAGQVDLMLVRVVKPHIKAYAFSRDSEHGNEKEVVFASPAKLTCIRRTHITDISVSKTNSTFQVDTKFVPAHLIEIEIN